MPAQDSQGRYVAPDETLTTGVLASASRTTSTAGTAFDTLDLVSVTGTLIVTNRSGTNPTLDVEVFGPLGPTFEFSVTPVTANRDN